MNILKKKFIIIYRSLFFWSNRSEEKRIKKKMQLEEYKANSKFSVQISSDT